MLSVKLSSKHEVLPSSQFVIIWGRQLEHVAHARCIPVLDLLYWHSIHINIPLAKKSEIILWMHNKDNSLRYFMFTLFFQLIVLMSYVIQSLSFSFLFLSYRYCYRLLNFLPIKYNKLLAILAIYLSFFFFFSSADHHIKQKK